MHPHHQVYKNTFISVHVHIIVRYYTIEGIKNTSSLLAKRHRIGAIFCVTAQRFSVGRYTALGSADQSDFISSRSKEKKPQNPTTLIQDNTFLCTTAYHVLLVVHVYTCIWTVVPFVVVVHASVYCTYNTCL